jgi:putative PIN family toxin of toxin-antitoxin system
LPPKIVLDTNCYISRLLSPSGGGAKLVNFMVLGTIRVFTSERQIAEILEVVKTQFQEPKKAHKYIPLSVGHTLEKIIRNKATIIQDRLMIKTSPDFDDNWILSIAINAKASLLVSQNSKDIYPALLPKSSSLRILGIAEALVFLETYR